MSRPRDRWARMKRAAHADMPLTKQWVVDMWDLSAAASTRREIEEWGRRQVDARGPGETHVFAATDGTRSTRYVVYEATFVPHRP